MQVGEWGILGKPWKACKDSKWMLCSCMERLRWSGLDWSGLKSVGVKDISLHTLCSTSMTFVSNHPGRAFIYEDVLPRFDISVSRFFFFWLLLIIQFWQTKIPNIVWTHIPYSSILSMFIFPTLTSSSLGYCIVCPLLPFFYTLHILSALFLPCSAPRAHSAYWFHPFLIPCYFVPFLILIRPHLFFVYYSFIYFRSTSSFHLLSCYVHHFVVLLYSSRWLSPFPAVWLSKVT